MSQNLNMRYFGLAGELAYLNLRIEAVERVWVGLIELLNVDNLAAVYKMGWRRCFMEGVLLSDQCLDKKKLQLCLARANHFFHIVFSRLLMPSRWSSNAKLSTPFLSEKAP